MSSQTPAGVSTIDVASWRARTIDARGNQASPARFRLFEDEDGSVESAHVDGGYVYVVTVDRRQTLSRVRVVDVATGKVVREATPADRPIDFVFN